MRGAVFGRLAGAGAASALSAVRATTQLRRLIAAGDIVLAPGVYDGLSAPA